MKGGLDGGSWAVQQLAGLLASISAYSDEQAMLTGAAHRIAEAIDAEVCALVTADGQIPIAIGFPADEIPVAALHEVVVADGGKIDVAGLGTLRAKVVELTHVPVTTVVLARSSSELTQDDLHLVRAMGQALTLALELRRTADRERSLRQRSETQATALRRANTALQEASRTKDMIISVASHELRTPLTSILGFASTLRKRGDMIDPETQRSYLEIVERQGQRLLHLIDDLLTVGRIEAGRASVQPDDVPLVATLRELMAATHQSVTVSGPASAVAAVDPGHLEQIVLNMVTNAEKYGAPPIEVEAAPDGDRIEVAVVDAGDGVPESFVPQLFERFSQASSGESRVSRGTGLGLAIVRGLAEANGGSARYERADSRTRFVVTLPAGRPADRPADEPSSATAATSHP